MNNFSVSDIVKRFPGKYGWHYVELDKAMSDNLRPLLKNLWPALLKASFKLNKTTWNSSIMPIKDGPLFIALPVGVRKSEKIHVGQSVKIEVKLLV